MQVKVRGAKDKIFTSVLKLAARSYTSNLFGSKMIPYLSFHISVLDLKGASGFCLALDNVKPREFEIEISKSNKITMLQTLAHEFVHAKQFAYGELKDKYVKKQLITTWLGQDCTNLDYWDRPWEIEAYGLESSLVAKFLYEHNKFKYFKTKYSNWFIEGLPDDNL